jgi:hypothetical protein
MEKIKKQLVHKALSDVNDGEAKWEVGKHYKVCVRDFSITKCKY